MIRQYKLKLSQKNGEPVPPFWAYRLYAWLLSQLPEDEAALFHQQDSHRISQYIYENIWTVSLFGREAIDSIGPVLERCEKISLHAEELTIESRSSGAERDAAGFLTEGVGKGRRAEIDFLTSTSFKQNSRYTIFPTENLIIQSLLSRWNEAFPEYILEDDDMLEAMQQGIHIVDYKLRSGRYALKDTSIPCFYGKIYVEARLPVVLQDIWNSLLSFGEYGNIGMKATLGMGGMRLAYPSKKQK